VSPTDLSSHAPWLESLRKSRARRFAANRARRRRWSGRSGAGVLLASLTLAAGGALAQDQSGGATPPAASQTASVAQIQSALGIAADGIAGPQTRRALKRFQRAHGLTPDGLAGPATVAALGLGGAQDASRQLDSAAAPSDADVLAKIAQCESGGDPTITNGPYRGKYQFTRATWRRYGGTGDPAKADEATQDAIAGKLLAAEGTAPWPVCGAGLTS
jgi:peptidoglycan hydrolase-like protein with peptidoglycan-binding domain